MQDILTEIDIIIKRNEKINTINKNKHLSHNYKLVHVEGTYVPFEQIINELCNISKEIKEDFNRGMELHLIKNKYLSQYRVMYVYECQNKPRIIIKYMDNSYLLTEVYSVDNPNLCIIRMSCISYLDDGLLSKFNTIFNDYIDDDYEYDTILADMLLQIMSGSIDDIYIELIETNEDYRGMGYMNIVICTTANFAKDILKKKRIKLYAMDPYDSYNTALLVNIIYPSFGFKTDPNIPPEIMNKSKYLYANIDDILTKKKCIYPSLKQ